MEFTRMLFVTCVVLLLPITTSAAGNKLMKEVLKKFNAMEQKLDELEVDNAKLKEQVQDLKSVHKPQSFAR